MTSLLNFHRTHDKFLELWDEACEVSKTEETSKHLKFGIIDCHKNEKLCLEHNIRQKIMLRFFGEKNKWPGLTKFLESTIDDVLREDELIERFDQPGDLLVLFKVTKNSKTVFE